MTRVLRIFSRLNIGGPALHVIHLSAGLVKYGFETRLVVGQTEEHEGDFLDLAKARGVDLEMVPELGRAIRPMKDVKTLLKLYRIVRREKPAIVHTHTAKAGVLGRIAARAAGVPIILHTYHGHVLSGYFSKITSAVFRRIEWGLAPATNVLLTVSDSVKEDLVRLGVARADHVRILPLGLDLEPLSHDLPRGALRRQAGWTDANPVVGIVGRLVPIKDLDTFVAAAVKVAASRKDVRFAIVGDGEERARLEPIATTALGDRVHFFGWRKDTAGVLGDLDLSVNTSLNEGTPVSLIEALAAGRSVVATTVGGTPDLLESGRFGALVPARDADGVARAILGVLEDPTGSRARAQAGQAMVLKRYSVNRLLDDMAGLYRELLAQHGRSVD